MGTVAVIAKAPAPGRSKTRLTPACSPTEAAALAEAALADTLEAVARCGARRFVLVLDGRPGEWLPAGFELIAQRGDGLAARLAAAFADIGERAFVIGMDTPQLDPETLGGALEHPCSLGPAPDGGYWGIGLPAPDVRVFRGVRMSRADTCARQRARMHACGYRPVELDAVRDVDTIADARAVAAMAPRTRFAARLREIEA